MDQTLRELGDLILKSVPTLIILLVLHIFFRKMFLNPLEQTLARRRALTEGAREEAKQSLELAEQKTAEYEEALRVARGEIYKEQEAHRKQAVEQQEKAILEAKQQAKQLVASAKEQLAAEAQQARARLAIETELLASQISERILTRRVS